MRKITLGVLTAALFFSLGIRPGEAMPTEIDYGTIASKKSSAGTHYRLFRELEYAKNQPRNTGLDNVLSAATYISFDARDDGKPNGVLNYSWEQISGPAIATMGGEVNPTNSIVKPSGVISNVVEGTEYSFKTLVTFFEPGEYVFRITIGDGEMNGHDDQKITVIKAKPEGPVAPGGLRFSQRLRAYRTFDYIKRK